MRKKLFLIGVFLLTGCATTMDVTHPSRIDASDRDRLIHQILRCEERGQGIECLTRILDDTVHSYSPSLQGLLYAERARLLILSAVNRCYDHNLIQRAYQDFDIARRYIPDADCILVLQANLGLLLNRPSLWEKAMRKISSVPSGDYDFGYLLEVSHSDEIEEWTFKYNDAVFLLRLMEANYQEVSRLPSCVKFSPGSFLYHIFCVSQTLETTFLFTTPPTHNGGVR
ncbi:hypothetical protein DRQ20_00650 [bacterium]|nr:MAG: hypothetical protein DRQ20_00650 [bacterium]